MDRRQFGIAVTAAASSALLGGIPAGAQTAASSASPWGSLGMLSARARRLGLSVPRMSANPTGGAGFSDVMPAVVDFLDHIRAAAKSSPAAQAEVDALLQDSSDLLIGLTSAERSPRNVGEAPEAGVRRTQYTFEALRDEYLQLFNTCTISPAHRSQVNWYINKLTDPEREDNYDAVEDLVCAPWYFVGIIHGLEASFNLLAHLHNGDPLGRRTFHVPANRPKVWLPPSDWPTSAEDALTIENFANQPDWSLARILYRWEAYNGFGSRRQGINTPYLWAFSNHYTKGKYVADGKWDANAVSSQCGAAVMLKVLVESGKVPLPA
jgi:lysozyme family protein